MRSFHTAVAGIVLLTSVAATVTPAAAQSRIETDTALASVIAAERAFANRSLRGGAQAAFLEHMAPGGLLYRPRVVRARAFLEARPMPPGLALIWEPALADVSRAGDLGYTTGPWISSRRDAPGADPAFGQYVTIWRRQSDGGWKAELHSGIAHPADPIGPQGVNAAPAPAWRGGGRADSTAARRALFAADSALAAAAGADGADTAFRQRAGPQLRILRMGRFPLMADSASAMLRATPTYRWQPVGGGVAASGDLGYTYGVYAIANPRARGGESGDYLRVWRRDASGTWRVVLDLTSPS